MNYSSFLARSDLEAIVNVVKKIIIREGEIVRAREKYISDQRNRTEYIDVT